MSSRDAMVSERSRALPVGWGFETIRRVGLVLLWDFGDTLADERWMRRPPASESDLIDLSR
jgi:hypothetical protein